VCQQRPDPRIGVIEHDRITWLDPCSGIELPQGPVPRVRTGQRWRQPFEGALGDGHAVQSPVTSATNLGVKFHERADDAIRVAAAGTPPALSRTRLANAPPNRHPCDSPFMDHGIFDGIVDET